MKDITRIHIAKVPYNIELSAKQELETYMSALEAYTEDNELLEEIEIRITELLLERGTKQDDVISLADVRAIREQLGEPKDFIADEVSTELDEEILSNKNNRKLYRNVDAAFIGGVLSGLASYLHVNVWWVRLAFIVLSFASAGLAILVYIASWLIIPPARTAAEKLQMTGRPVTLSSIRELNELGTLGNVNKRSETIGRVATILLGLMAVTVAVASVVTLAVVTFELVRDENSAQAASYHLPLILMYICGALLFILSVLVAVASFAQKFNKRIWVSAVIITAVGITLFASAFFIIAVQERLNDEAIERNTIEMSEKLPDNFALVTTLSIDVPNMINVYYVVDAKSLIMKQRMLKGSDMADVVVEDDTATITIKESDRRQYGAAETVTIYGPAIEGINIDNGRVVYSAGSQSNIRVNASGSSSLSLNESRIDSLDMSLEDSASVDGLQASISSVNVKLSEYSNVDLGNIKTLAVRSIDACGVNSTATVNVQNILSATYEYNGVTTASRSLESPCFSITVANNPSYELED